MNKPEFQAWLRNEKNLGLKSARDVVSRCGRVERIFDIALDDIVGSPDAVEAVRERLRQESASYLKADTTSASSAVSGLRRAVRLYAEYANS